MTNATMPAKPKATAEVVEVTLIASHKHKGKQRAKGDKIKVNSRRKAWLIQHKKVAE